jgi:hypothetical protein
MGGYHPLFVKCFKKVKALITGLLSRSQTAGAGDIANNEKHRSMLYSYCVYIEKINTARDLLSAIFIFSLINSRVLHRPYLIYSFPNVATCVEATKRREFITFTTI